MTIAKALSASLVVEASRISSLKMDHKAITIIKLKNAVDSPIFLAHFVNLKNHEGSRKFDDSADFG
jgi:hypothetical protein